MKKNMKEDKQSSTLGKTGSSHEQKLVDEHFDAESMFWRDTYQQNDALGFINRQRQAVALRYVDELALPKTARVLEIGCGAGFLSIALAKRGFAVEAVDHASAMVELAQRHARETGVDNRIHAAIEDVHELTFEDESFDLIVALGVINWLHDLEKALAEITRVLKHCGYAVLNSARAHALLNPLAIPAFESILEGVKLELERATQRNPRNVAPRHMYLPREINQYLCGAGLTIMKSTQVGFGPFRILNHDMFPYQDELKIQQKLQQYADKGYPILRLAGGQYIVLARKK
jgi:2-polyprenyl-3-methyl-5-hydroxy-6-metoxy-1,4-benzoquinol methylase